MLLTQATHSCTSSQWCPDVLAARNVQIPLRLRRHGAAPHDLSYKKAPERAPGNEHEQLRAIAAASGACPSRRSASAGITL
jgi:hypothetical protein